MTKEEVFQVICEWERDNGEDFLDQGFNLNEATFMTWCFGRGYLNREQYNLWINNMNTLEGSDANYYVYDSDNDVPWAIVSSDEWNEEDQKRAYMILSEFISGIDVYVNRFKEYVE